MGSHMMLISTLDWTITRSPVLTKTASLSFLTALVFFLGGGGYQYREYMVSDGKIGK
jgi:hypothetical protein